FQFVDSVLWSNFDVAGLVEAGLREHNFEWILNGALNFLDQVDKESPFLLYFASTAVHGPNHLDSLYANPHISPAGHVELPLDYYPSRSQILRELHENTGGKPHHIDAGMLCLDYQVAAIRKKLAEQGLDRNTVIIYLSDHGVEPGKATSYLRGTRIPFIATWLGKNDSTSTSEEIVQVCDILPTIWDLATDGSKPPKGEWDGRSFASVLRGEPFSGREFAYFENGYTRSVYRDGMHYIVWRYPQSIINKMRSGELTEAPDHLNTFDTGQASITMEEISSYWNPDQLFDANKDPYETTNLFGNPEYADQLKILQQDLQGILSTFKHPFDLAPSTFQNSSEFDKLKQPRIDRGTSYIYWYEPGQYAWPPKGEQ
ncbi:MAG: sulfatase, partial [Puniceicoccaceae bacterium]